MHLMMTKFFLSLLAGLLIAAVFLLKRANESYGLSGETHSFLETNSKLIDKDLKALAEQVLRWKNVSDSLAARDNDLEQLLANSNLSWKDEQQRLIKLNSAFKDLNRKYDHVLARQRERFKKLGEAAVASARLRAENRTRNAQIEALVTINHQLAIELTRAKELEKDNIFIEPVDEEGKPCAIGSRVKKILATLSLSHEIKSPVFKMFDPEGNLITDQAENFTFVTSRANDSPKMEKLEMTYQLPRQIGSGLYRVEIANDGKHIGNLLMKFK